MRYRAHPGTTIQACSRGDRMMSASGDPATAITTNITVHMPAISLCMIVKDEEEVLARCLSSVRDLVDEIIIVDTGSADATVEIARSFGAEVHHFTWIDDFAAARNVSFEKATSPYLLWLDADDVIEPDDLRRLMELKAHMDKDIYYLRYNYAGTENGMSLCTFYRERIVRRACGIRWTYPIHECMVLNGGLTSEQQDITITHRRTEAGARADESRNLRILERAITTPEYCNSPRICYYLGKEYMDHRRYYEALERLRRFLAMPEGWIEDRIGAQHRIARAYHELAALEPDRARTHLQQARTEAKQARLMDTRWAEPHFLLGRIAFDEGDYEEAVFWYEKCLRPAPEVLSPLDLYCYAAGPLVQLCLCHARLGNYELAQSFNERALEYYPGDASLLGNRELFNDMLNRKREDMPEISAPDTSEQAGNTAGGEAGDDPEAVTDIRKVDTRPLLVIHSGGALEPWTSANLHTSGIGGSETAAARMAEELARMGYRSVVFSNCAGMQGTYDGVEYLDYGEFDAFIEEHEIDTCIASRNVSVLTRPIRARRRYLWLHDVIAMGTQFGEGDLVRSLYPTLDGIFCLSPWHCEHAARTHGIPMEKMILTGNGIDVERFDRAVERRPNRFIYTSSPDRGLDTVLGLFPVLRTVFPDAELHIFYGFDYWDATIERSGNKEMRKWRDSVYASMNQPGVYYHGRVGQEQLAEEFLRSDVWFYPTRFIETYCITALEAQMAGTLCICTDLAGLKSTVGDRGILLSGDPRSTTFVVEALRQVIAIQNDPGRKAELITRAKVWAREQTWHNRALEWAALMNDEGNYISEGTRLLTIPRLSF